MNKRAFKGKIVSEKMDKTVVVAIDIVKRHKIYSKALKATKKLSARNETDAKFGDLVKIEECRPYSKNSSWKVIEKI